MGVAVAYPTKTDLRLPADGAFSNQLSQQRARRLCLPCAQIKSKGSEERGTVRRNQPLGLSGNRAVQLGRNFRMRSPVILRLHKIERLERSGSQERGGRGQITQYGAGNIVTAGLE